MVVFFKSFGIALWLRLNSSFFSYWGLSGNGICSVTVKQVKEEEVEFLMQFLERCGFGGVTYD